MPSIAAVVVRRTALHLNPLVGRTYGRWGGADGELVAREDRPEVERSEMAYNTGRKITLLQLFQPRPKTPGPTGPGNGLSVLRGTVLAAEAKQIAEHGYLQG